MTLQLRNASPDDAPEMAALLNELIQIGGTTAHQSIFDSARLESHYILSDLAISCVIATKAGRILGFQALEWCDPKYTGPSPLPSNWASIATFVRHGSAGQGVGRNLFDRTLARANSSGATAIDATIRADNISGLAYYSAMGFQDYQRLKDVPLADGTKIDRIRKRFDLDA